MPTRLWHPERVHELRGEYIYTGEERFTDLHNGARNELSYTHTLFFSAEKFGGAAKKAILPVVQHWWGRSTEDQPLHALYHVGDCLLSYLIVDSYLSCPASASWPCSFGTSGRGRLAAQFPRSQSLFFTVPFLVMSRGCRIGRFPSKLSCPPWPGRGLMLLFGQAETTSHGPRRQSCSISPPCLPVR
jgi:hypothetical protein